MADGSVIIEIDAETKNLYKNLNKAKRALDSYQKEEETSWSNLYEARKRAAEAAEKTAFGGKTNKQSRKEFDDLLKKSEELLSVLEEYGSKIGKLTKKQQKFLDFQSQVNPNLDFYGEKFQGKLFKKKILPERAEAYYNYPEVKQESDQVLDKLKQKLEERKESRKQLKKLMEKIELGPEVFEAKANIFESQENIKYSKEEIDSYKKAIEDLNREKRKILSKEALGGLEKPLKALTSPKGRKSLGFFDKLKAKIDNVSHSFKYFWFQVKTALLWGVLLSPLMKVFDTLRGNLFAVATQSNAFSQSLANLKGTIWTASAPALVALTDWLTVFMDKLAVAITYVGTFINALFGLSAVSKKTVKNFATAKDAAKGAGKTKKDKSLASWDTVQKLTKPVGDSGAGSGTQQPVPPTFEQDFSKAQKALEEFKRILAEEGWYGVGEEIGKRITEAISKIDPVQIATSISNGIRTALQLVAGFIDGIDFSLIGQKLRDFFLNIDWGGIAHDAVVLFGEGLKAAFEFLSGVLGIDFTPIIDGIDWMVESITTLLDLVSGKIKFDEFWESLSAGQKAFALIAVGLVGAGGIIALFHKLKDAFSLTSLVSTGMSSKVLPALFKAFGFIKSPIGIAIIAIGALVGAIAWLADNWEMIKQKTSEIMENIKMAIKNGIDAVVKSIEKAPGPIKAVINGLMFLVESAINGIKKALSLLKLDFTVPDWVPIIGGKRVDTTYVPVKLPRFAEGGLVNPGHEFAAILGDNRREQEIVSPVSTMKQALMDALAESGRSYRGDIVLELDGHEFARIANPLLQNETNRIGIVATGG